MVRPKQKLVIAGDTSDTDDYVTLLKEKAADNPNIIFTGFISGEVLEEMYSNAYAVCLPSDLEGMSISLLEALAYKNTLLCSDIPENTAVAEDKAMFWIWRTSYRKFVKTNHLQRALKPMPTRLSFQNTAGTIRRAQRIQYMKTFYEIRYRKGRLSYESTCNRFARPDRSTENPRAAN